jgi:hypothetical protein
VHRCDDLRRPAAVVGLPAHWQRPRRCSLSPREKRRIVTSPYGKPVSTALGGPVRRFFRPDAVPGGQI